MLISNKIIRSINGNLIYTRLMYYFLLATLEYFAVTETLDPIKKQLLLPDWSPLDPRLVQKTLITKTHATETVLIIDQRSEYVQLNS